MNALVIAEHDNAQLKAATLNTIHAALQLTAHCDVLVAGYDCAAVVETLQTISGVQQILLADAPQYRMALAENLADLVLAQLESRQYVLAPASTFGKNLIPRIAALSDVAAISDIIAIESGDTFVRPVYAGNALETVQSLDALTMITVRSSAFEAAQAGQQLARVVPVGATDHLQISSFDSHQLSDAGRVELTSAQVVVSGGRGLASKQNFALIEALAEKLGGAVGASRAAVDAGFVGNDSQVGQTGKIVAPDLYIAVGISGAIQHLAGMKDSKVIVAINQDADAPIFQIADYGLVADLFEVLPELIEQV